MKIDELNNLGASDNLASFDYDDFIKHYFDTMQINKKQRKKRIEAAEELFDAILFFLSWCEEFPEKVQTDDVKRQFENDYKEVAFQYGTPDVYFDKYVPFFINNLIETTLNHQGEEYFTSVERAANLAVNESNTIIQYEELKEAIENGYNVKIWHTQLDDRVRDSHEIIEGMKAGILDYFPVGSSMLLFPRDEKNASSLSDIAGCRCSLEFDYDANYPVFLTDKLYIIIENAPPQAYEIENDVSRDNKDEISYYSKQYNETLIGHKLENSDNVYISDKLHIDIDSITQIIDKYNYYKHFVGMPDNELCKILVIDTTELGLQTAGTYDAISNTLIYKYLYDEKNLAHSILHELYHWKDAFDLKMGGYIFNNKNELVSIEREMSKPILDNLGINIDNVDKISDYAEQQYFLGNYEEAYTEYRTAKDLGEIDSL